MTVSILVVDDDVRNIFSLTSVLEDHGMVVRFAENGKQAIEQLKKDPNVDAVLMDIMMPEMDGYETTKAIRALDQFKALQDTVQLLLGGGFSFRTPLGANGMPALFDLQQLDHQPRGGGQHFEQPAHELPGRI